MPYSLDFNNAISLESILDNAPIIVWALDKNGYFTMSQGKALEALGLKNSELIGKNHFDLFPETESVALARRALNGETFTEDTFVMGRWYSSTYSPIRKESEIIGMSAISIDITDKKITQQKLHESEKRFEIMANSAPVLVWIADTTKACTWFNKNWLDWTGRSLADEYGFGWAEKIHPEDYERCLKIYTECFDKRAEFKMEYRLLHRDGDYRWLLDHGVPRFGNDHAFEGFIGACIDIQDEKDKENLPSLIIEAIPQGVWRTNPDGSADYFSPRFYTLVNYTPEEFLGWGWAHNIHPEDQGACLTEWERCRKNKESVSVEFRVLMKDGSYRWFLSLGNPIFDKEGNIFKYYGTWTDIHEQKLARELISYQSQLTKTITDNATSCLFMMDKDGHPTFMNPAAMQVTGYTSLEEIEGKPLHYSIHRTKLDGSFYPMEECPLYHAQMAFKPVRKGSENFCRKDGSIFPVIYSVMPLEKDGMIVGTVLEFQDVTEQRNIERSLNEAITARDEFLSIASHELKTPLTTLLIQSQLQRRMMNKGEAKALTEERIRQLIDQNERLTGRLNRLVDDMLDISRIRSGKLKIEKEKADLQKIALDVTSRLSPSFAASGCGQPEIHAEKVEGYWDVMRLEQVFTNLLNNAMRYGKNRPIEILIQSKNQMAVVGIKDYGIGIAAQDQEKIFKRFERAVNANDISGLGLGLYISEQIIKSHDGNIWVESELGKGSTFYFTLPL